MDDQTDVGKARAARGLMTSTGFQENVDFAQRKDTAVSRSRIAGVDTMAAQELDAEGAGAQSHLTTERINCGGTAGEEDDPNQ